MATDTSDPTETNHDHQSTIRNANPRLSESRRKSRSGLKVCVLTTRHHPNDDRIYYKQVLSLANRYSNITLMAPESPGNEPEKEDGIDFQALPPRKGMLGRLRLIFDAIIAVRRLKPDICHFHDYDLIAAVPFIKFGTKAQLVYDAHEAYADMARISDKIPKVVRPLIARLVEFAEKRAARKCSLVITADDATAESFKIRQMPTITIFNYPRIEIFRRNLSLEQALEERYSDRKVLIYQGSMGEDRGLSKMVEALPRLKEMDESYLLMLVGLKNKSMREKTENYARQLGASECLEVIPWVKHIDIASYMRVARVGLIPWQPTEKHMKNIPIKLFEYMVCGIPVLTADLPPIRPYIHQSNAGLLYDSTSPKEMAKGVHEIISDSQAWSRMSDRGFQYVTQSWNWDCMERRLLESYSQLEKGAVVI